MPRPVCVPCGREMRGAQSGTVQFNALSTRGPYQQYQADLHVCEQCGTVVAARYASQPSWEHFHGEATRDKAPLVIVYEIPVVPVPR